MSSSVEKMTDWYAGVPRAARMHTLFGFCVLGITLFGFGVWASTAPIAGAIIASGVFVTNGQNKVIQHLEGGVIREILVREGDVVEPGQLLLLLDDTSPKAELRRLLFRYDALQATEARLNAEIKDEPEVSFPKHLLARNSEPDVKIILDSVVLNFEARRKNLLNEIATIQDGIVGLEQRVKGTKIQLAGVHSQLGLFKEELESKSTLLAGGHIRKSEVLALRRAYANLEGEVGRLEGDLGDSRERIARAKEQILGVRTAAVKAAVEKLHETRSEMRDVRERISAARGVLDRIKVTAPVKGIVVKLRYHTPTGVVEPGKGIMEIVPLQDELIIEAHVRPQDIENVTRGQTATIRLTALNRRTVPTIDGEVIYVSADALPSDKPAQQGAGDSYVVRIRMDKQSHVPQGFEPTPGMPVEVYIKTKERTMLGYLLRPLSDSMVRAFREQ